MMDKITDIKEVLHLYYGCDIEHEDDFFTATRLKLDGRMIDRWNSNCVLLLRPLTTITDEETLEVCAVACPLPFQGRNTHRFKVDRSYVADTEYIAVDNKNNDYSFNIDLTDGEVKVYRMVDEEVPSDFPQLVTIWYLKKGFDIFNLIPRKLAEVWTPEKPVIVD